MRISDWSSDVCSSDLHHHPRKHVLTIRPALSPSTTASMDGLYEQFRIALHSVWRRRWLALAAAWRLCLPGWLVLALVLTIYQPRARAFAQMQSILPTQTGIPEAA